ncbi:MAG: DNA methylase [Fibrobacteraceae bacterium]|nr:DNA methylase [Fibrobacteraceae bacterium]
MQESRTYIAIDLKSFYASVACMDLGLDPLASNLVVADPTRTEKTICLAVSPSLKKLGVPGRPRLFEVIRKIKEINRERLRKAPGHQFTGKSTLGPELEKNPSLQVDFCIAKPTMARYMEISTQIYHVYLKYISHEDIHVYSIDEVFMDVTAYLKTYKMTAKELAMKMILDVLRTTGITATAGIGTNLYLSKVAMDIMAKHIPADQNGVRIAELDEQSYREKLWNHRPLTAFWRVGKGYANRLEANRLYTMGDIARCSIKNEDFLYKLFGVNAQLLIDHAWGFEPCTIAHIKSYKPSNHSISQGQVLTEAYEATKGRLVVLEMADMLVLDLVYKNLQTDQIVLTVMYDVQNITDPKRLYNYQGEIVQDQYGRKMPKPAHGSINLGKFTSSTKSILDAVGELYDKLVNKNLLIRKIYVVANHTLYENQVEKLQQKNRQYDLFNDTEEKYRLMEEEKAKDQKERKMQKALISIKKRFGKNAVLKGMNFEEGATTKDRNRQIGGHRA